MLYHMKEESLAENNDWYSMSTGERIGKILDCTSRQHRKLPHFYTTRRNKENKLGQSEAKHFHRRACQLLRVLLEAYLPEQTNLYSGFTSEYQIL